jgi:hypothetical protein
MRKYSVFLAPKTEDSFGKIVPNNAKHWELIGKIESKNKKSALEWLKKNQAVQNGFMFVLMQPKFEG